MSGKASIAAVAHALLPALKRRIATPRETARDCETVGYVIQGRAELESEGQRIVLTPGDSWVVPKGALHRYRILEDFLGVEATAPPSQVHGRDEAQA